jgi:hypothetical protein
MGENEHYILNLLAQKLGQTGLNLVTSYNQSNLDSFQAADDIRNSAFFIGLITSAGPPSKTNRVYQEFKQADLHRKPAILLIEDAVEVDPWIAGYQNTVKFSRHYPEYAIEEVRRRIKASETPQANSNATAWVLGGIGVLALLSWLSEKQR